MKWLQRWKDRRRRARINRGLARYAKWGQVEPGEDFEERVAQVIDTKTHTHPKTGQALKPETVARWKREAEEAAARRKGTK